MGWSPKRRIVPFRRQANATAEPLANAKIAVSDGRQPAPVRVANAPREGMANAPETPLATVANAPEVVEPSGRSDAVANARPGDGQAEDTRW